MLYFLAADVTEEVTGYRAATPGKPVLHEEFYFHSKYFNRNGQMSNLRRAKTSKSSELTLNATSLCAFSFVFFHHIARYVSSNLFEFFLVPCDFVGL